jgi:lysophospholipase L1-like esterase
MRFLFLSLSFWILFPVYAVVGLITRARSIRTRPANGPLSGQFGAGEAEIDLLAVGDSSIACVGIARTEDGLCCQLAHKLHVATGKPVAWRIRGFNSATAGRIASLVVPNLERRPHTHIVVGLGINDVKNMHSVNRWKREFGGLLYALHARFPTAQIWWMPVLDMRKVPGLPWPLGALMRMRAELLNAMGSELCRERRANVAPPLIDVTPEGFCADGFHASETGYEFWAEQYCAAILSHEAAPKV